MLEEGNDVCGRSTNSQINLFGALFDKVRKVPFMG